MFDDEDSRAPAARHAEELRQLLVHNRTIDQFNAAVDAGRSGDYSTAISLLEQVLASTADPELRQRAEELLEMARQSEGKR